MKYPISTLSCILVVAASMAQEPTRPTASVHIDPIPELAPTRVEKTKTHIHIHHANGQTTVLARHDAIDTAVSSSWRQREDGLYEYTYQIDTRQVNWIHIGWLNWPAKDIIAYSATAEGEQPQGWHFSSIGWVQQSEKLTGVKPDASDKAHFRVISSYGPGPVPMYLQGDLPGDDTLSTGARRLHGVTAEMASQMVDDIHANSSWWNDSVIKLVVGPQVKPDATESDLQSIAELWARAVNAPALRDFARSSNPAAAVAEIDPARSELERMASESLRRALPHARRDLK